MPRATPPNPWAAVTWANLRAWAGDRAAERGRAYQRGGQVRRLAIDADGQLLVTVEGTERYATAVAPRPLASRCTCPVGVACKHAVAVVAEYLAATEEGRPVPVADPDDPRWDHLDADVSEGWEDEGEEGDPPPARPKRPASADADLERFVRGQSQAELADRLLALAKRIPAVRRELRDRASLQRGDAGKLLAETRSAIHYLTDQIYDDEPGGAGMPTFAPLRRRLERLIELDRADEVVSLGRELIRAGNRLIENTDDEGETAEGLAGVMPTVFRALLRSSLPGPERLQFLVDAILEDEYGTAADAAGSALDQGPWTPRDWSAVADELAARLAALPRRRNTMRDYRRDTLTTWLGRALAGAEREDEVGELYEAEVRETGNYERYVDYLIAEGREADAERWAAEGIRATADKLPGVAEQLARRLRTLTEGRGAWDVAAAFEAQGFFAHPSAGRFNALMAAARKAGVDGPVRAAARRFLETGVAPYRPASAGAETRVRRGTKPPPAPPGFVADAEWPLPLPAPLAPLMRVAAAPHLDVLLELALGARQPDEILHWYDRLKTGHSGFADRVAAAVASAHPQRALDIYRAALDRQLPHASPTAYDAAADYLRRLRPLYEALRRGPEWPALVAELRERYRNRPRFVERLDALGR